MNNLLNIKIDIDLEELNDFYEDMDDAFQQQIESYLSQVRQFDANTVNVVWMKSLFYKLSVRSIRVNMVVLSECLDDLLKCFETFIRLAFFSKRASELMLLVMDRFLMVTEGIVQEQQYNMLETQNITVVLQNVFLAEKIQGCEEAIEKGLTLFSQQISSNSDEEDLSELFLDMVDTETDFDDSAVEFFDQADIEFFDQESNSLTIKSRDVQTPDLMLGGHAGNPLLQAQEVIRAIYEDETFALLSLIADKDTFYYDSHTHFLLEIGLAINFICGQPSDTLSIAKGICIHDIALAPISDILNKPEKPTQDEFEQIKQHPVRAVHLAKSLNIGEDGINLILHHHERLNGSGYPHNLRGDEISEAGKMIGIIDSFHAMIYQRPHRLYSRSAFRAIAELNANVGTLFDQYWIKQFNQLMIQHWLLKQKKKQKQLIKNVHVAHLSAI